MTQKFTPKAIIFDFTRTLYDPNLNKLEEGALDVLRVLHKKIPLAIYAKDKTGRTSELDELGIKGFFDAILVVKEKSGSDIKSLAEKMNVKPHEVLLIGDRVKAEIRAGKEAGCMTIWLKKGKFAGEEPESKGEQPDAIVSNLREVLDLIAL